MVGWVKRQRNPTPTITIFLLGFPMSTQPTNSYRQLVEVYRQPEGNSYQNVQQFFRGDILTIEAFDEINLTVDEILGLRTI